MYKEDNSTLWLVLGHLYFVSSVALSSLWCLNIIFMLMSSNFISPAQNSSFSLTLNVQPPIITDIPVEINPKWSPSFFLSRLFPWPWFLPLSHPDLSYFPSVCARVFFFFNLIHSYLSFTPLISSNKNFFFAYHLSTPQIRVSCPASALPQLPATFRVALTTWYWNGCVLVCLSDQNLLERD